MENKSFFIQYLQNQPLNIETHVDVARKTRENPLVVVSHLIQAFFPNEEPAILSQYSLHQIKDSIEIEALFPDVSLVDDIGGQSARDPLRIKTTHLPIALTAGQRQGILV
jgi:hypothetical protein